MEYEIYLKSHTVWPDYNEEIKADSEEHAIDKFYEMLRGEFSREEIKRNMRSNEN